MAGNKKRSSFSFFSFFKGRSSSSRRGEYETRDEYVKAYKVYPSDEDRGRWVAEPRIDEKASAYITHTTDKWGKLDAD
ncbi:hypothetical protein C2S53_002770 [Perilla frutescens var. hirtella]|uniref:Uncharacterized protein n=1 Tax=Perilla frutescens var. hirtella TaxID=608512 RepID=A0AAD4PD48_PERFH|nr:hypothetical protein C2S53_002770 [Perilla frutescens var. hirtella]